jgi:hypothetical protein
MVITVEIALVFVTLLGACSLEAPRSAPARKPDPLEVAKPAPATHGNAAPHTKAAADDRIPPEPSQDGVGIWGETVALTPDFGYPQERRCPKVPAGDKLFNELAAPAAAEHVRDALLVCYADITNEVAWDFFAGPDLQFRFQFGDRPAITLWGPEDHWHMYVSIPSATFDSGDLIRVAAWDRDETSMQLIGSASLRYDGRFPIRLEDRHDGTRFFTVDCRLMSEPSARAHAQARLKTLDDGLNQLGRRRPDPSLIYFGGEASGELSSHSVTRSFYDGNFRYPAGFLGWEHPIIQARLERLKKIESDWRARAHELAVRLMHSAHTQGEWVALEDKRALKLTAKACGPEAEPLAGRPLGIEQCAFAFETRNLHFTCAVTMQSHSLASVTEEPTFATAEIVARTDSGVVGCDDPDAFAKADRYIALAPAGAMLAVYGGQVRYWR